MKTGITLAGATGIGDRLNFTSFPENYFAATGTKLIDIDQCWCFDHNPFVTRGEQPDKILNPWLEPLPKLPPQGRPVWHSVAERTMVQFGLDPRHIVLRHPRLYKFEDEPKHHRLVVHTTGVTRGQFSPKVISHIAQKYKDWQIVQVGGKEDIDFPNAENRRGVDLWEVARTIAGAEVFIGICSGPSWIAACYPSVWSKKILMHLSEFELIGPITPMAFINKHWQWFDNSFIYFNRTEQDLGFTYSYRKL
jgi:hypothetical protein